MKVKMSRYMINFGIRHRVGRNLDLSSDPISPWNIITGYKFKLLLLLIKLVGIKGEENWVAIGSPVR